MEWKADIISENQLVPLPWKDGISYQVHIKREDEIHPIVSGNKWRKLKYNIQAALGSGAIGLVTFGGAFSNHILATACAARTMGLRSVGLIRGEENLPLNPTLMEAVSMGMELHYVNRTIYREDKQGALNSLGIEGNFHLIPEGGANELGVKGCEEILTEADRNEFDIICCSAGTGGTAAGLLRTLGAHQELFVYPALKGDFMTQEICRWLPSKVPNWQLVLRDDYSFGGYAKTNNDLFRFIKNIYTKIGLKLDPGYTGKMAYGVVSDMASGHISGNAKILLIHTGGLQGTRGIEKREKVNLFGD